MRKYIKPVLEVSEDMTEGGIFSIRKCTGRRENNMPVRMPVKES